MNDPPTTVVDKYEQAILDVLRVGRTPGNDWTPFTATLNRGNELVPRMREHPVFGGLSSEKQREAIVAAMSRLLQQKQVTVEEYTSYNTSSGGNRWGYKRPCYMPVDLKKSSPFEMVSVPYGDTGQRRQVARYTCEGCGGSHDIPVTSGIGLGTDAHRNVLAQRGCDVSSRGVINACPQCPPKEKPMNEQLKPTSVENIKKMLETTPALPPVTLAPVQPPAVEARRPTPDQRLSIRSALDHHFDDATGCYLNGYSDQRIAEELKIPRKFVEDIREAAYGPIRMNPEVLALQEELKKLKTAVQVFEDRLRKLEPSQG